MARNDYFTDREMDAEDIERGFLFAFKKLLDTEGSSDLWIVAQTKAQMTSSATNYRGYAGAGSIDGWC